MTLRQNIQDKRRRQRRQKAWEHDRFDFSVGRKLKNMRAPIEDLVAPQLAYNKMLSQVLSTKDRLP